MSFSSKSPFKDPFLYGVAVIFFAIGFGISESIKENRYFPIYQSNETAVYQACFTPAQRCLPLIIKEIDKAQKTIRVQAYSFTSKEIAQALIKAHVKGIKVIVIADKSQKKAHHTQVKELISNHIAVLFDTKPAIAHNKIIIIDEQTVITGSYNFTKAAELRNAENLIVLKDKAIVQQYLNNFNRRLAVTKVS